MPATATNLTSDFSPKSNAILRLTRILIISDHPVQSKDVTTNLRQLGFDVQLALFDGKTLNATPVEAPDAILCHLTDYAEQGPKLAKVIRAHYAPRAIPIIGALSRPSEKESSEFDSTLFAPMHTSQIANRVNAMVRLGVMESEISRRLETLKEDFNLNPQLGDMSPDRRFRVLFIGKASPSFMVIINALQDKGVDVVAAFTSFSAFDYLHGETFDAVVMNALEQSEPALSISEAMRRNAKLYHIPTLFLIDQEVFKDQDAAYQHGARDIISINAEAEEIGGRILELANYHRIHEQLKADIFALTDKSAKDESGSAFSQSFMRAHLPRLLADASSSNQPISLLGIKLTPNSTEEVLAEFLENAYSQTADLMQNLVRMQDVVSRWDVDCFVLAFYNADITETKIILSRLQKLIDCAAYKSGSDQNAPLTFSCESHIHKILPNIGSAGEHLRALMTEFAAAR